MGDEYMEFQTLVAHTPDMNPQFANKYTLYIKYNLIIGVTVNLDESFNLIRTCILKEISVIYFSPARLVSIPEFTTRMIGTLEKKNLANEFTKKIVVPVNTKKEAAGRRKNPNTPARAWFPRKD